MQQPATEPTEPTNFGHRHRIVTLSALPGRARLRIAGLYHNHSLQHRLEQYILTRPDIQRASATTGTLLVEFTKTQAFHCIRAHIETLLGTDTNADDQCADMSTTASPHPFSNEPFPPWHSKSARMALRALHTHAKQGLSADEAQLRQVRHGLNRLPKIQPRSKRELLLEQVRSLPNALLGASAGISLVTRARLDAAVILGVTGLNTLIGYRSEQQAELTLRGLDPEAPEPAKVRRDGQAQALEQSALVPGDILILAPGDSVAADARLLTAHDLQLDESSLTGESLPIAKRADWVTAINTPLGDRNNMVFMGTRVSAGSGIGVVVATGACSVRVDSAPGTAGGHAADPYATPARPSRKASNYHGRRGLFKRVHAGATAR